MSSPRHVSGPQSSDARTPSSFSHFLRGSLFRLSRLIGNSLLYGSIFALITGSIAYAATGTKMLPNFLSSGVDFMSFFSNSGDGTAGIDARSYYTRVNGSWMGYPGDNRNYLRGGTFLSGSIYDEDDSAYYVNPNGISQFNTMSGKTICLNGDCKTGWSGVNGIGYGQTWQDVTLSRAMNNTYTNTTSKPIFVSIVIGSPVSGPSEARLYVDSIVVDYYTTNAYNGGVHAIVPPGSTYKLTGSNITLSMGDSSYGWKELR